ncbi:amino acid/polyamine transporter I [Microdochium trichocladiopsis]|uniref:Amino acid/polyamine transporter I n=1 Tax=Microdochium trichocladiopsis TaxID=1682393 RepID=A0A9P8YHG7_9PEZI|nr:amino acid/polyamine transporter I [Microdochium trichocladiopsis]KAH7040596.1 amino acid/polyamine transporter I [Microdochium trichocladiopsis]
MVLYLRIDHNMYYALFNGGPVAFLFNYLVVFIGVLAQTACLAELASNMPIAGAQYYWTYAYSPEKYRLFLTWLQGWATWLAFVATLASILNGNVINLEARIQINSPDYVPGGWHTTLIFLATMAFLTVLNLWVFEVVPWFELVSGVLNLVFFVITFVALWVMAPRNSPEFFLSRTKYSTWDNDYVSWSFECVIHMGEETENDKRAVPQAMFWSIACMPPVEDLLMSSNPYIYLISTATGSRSFATIITTGINFVCLGCGISSFSSTTLLTWDGGLPRFFGHVDAKNRVPMRAVLLTCFLVALLSLLNLGTGTYIAFGAVTSLSSLGSYFSYAIILGVALHKRLTSGLQTSDWSMGRIGTPVNIFALVYTVYSMIWLPFPTTLPVTATGMNYSGPVFATVIAGAIGSWFLWGKKHWLGPNQGVAEIVLRGDAGK